MDEPLEFEELWALEFDDKPGQLVCPLDGNSHEDQGALVYFSESAAYEAALHQLDYCEIKCTPRRIVTE